MNIRDAKMPKKMRVCARLEKQTGNLLTLYQRRML